MRKYALLALAFAPFVAAHADQCAHSADRSLDADLRGVRSVRLETGSHDLKVNASGSGTSLAARGKACASSEDALSELVITQHRDGDTLVVKLGDDRSHWHFGSSYQSFKVDVAMPANLPVQLEVGSGDGETHGVASLVAHVGSGDAKLYDTAGAVRASVGSGDLTIEGAGNVQVDSIGSGDAKLRNTHGPVSVGSVGSGDLDMQDIGGNVEVDSIGSGDVKVDNVRGDLAVHSKGSGDISHSGVTGKVSVPRED
jgi:putative autotransporter adhesin-like protein